MIVLLYFDMDNLFICIQLLTFFSPSWLKIVMQYICSIAAKIDSYMFMMLSSSLFFFFLNLQLFYLSIITTIEHIKDYKYRALLSWSLGSFKYKLSERYPFCRLGFFMSIQLFLFAAVLTSSLPADVPRCCSHRQK